MTEAPNDQKTQLQWISLEKLKPDPKNLRTEKDYAQADPQMQELIQSIRINGMLQPPRVRAEGEFFVLRIGHRRFFAAKYLGWKGMNCVVETVAGVNDDLVPLIENGVRKRSDPVAAGAQIVEAQKKYLAAHPNEKNDTAFFQDLSTKTGLPSSVLRDYVSVYEKSSQLRAETKKALAERINAGKLGDAAIRATFKREGITPETGAKMLTQSADRGATAEQIMVAAQMIQREHYKKDVSAAEMKKVIDRALEAEPTQILMTRTDYRMAMERVPKKFTKHFLGELLHRALADESLIAGAIVTLKEKYNISTDEEVKTDDKTAK